MILTLLISLEKSWDLTYFLFWKQVGLMELYNSQKFCLYFLSRWAVLLDTISEKLSLNIDFFRTIFTDQFDTQITSKCSTRQKSILDSWWQKFSLEFHELWQIFLKTLFSWFVAEKEVSLPSCHAVQITRNSGYFYYYIGKTITCKVLCTMRKQMQLIELDNIVVS